MNRLTGWRSIVCALALAAISPEAGGQVVISQIYPGGGSSTSTFKYDWVELLNISDSSYDLTGHSLQIGSGISNIGNATNRRFNFPTTATIQAKQYLLIQCGTAATNAEATDIPTTPELDTGSGVLDIPHNGGRVALCNTTTALNAGGTATALPLPDSRVLDLVAWETNGAAEGGARINGISGDTGKVLVRKNLGQQDTDNNAADFDVLLTSNPAAVSRNSGVFAPVNLSSFQIE